MSPISDIRLITIQVSYKFEFSELFKADNVYLEDNKKKKLLIAFQLG